MGKFKQKIMNWLQKLQIKLDESNVKAESLFEDLTPSNDVDTDGNYSEALSWGLKNKKVKNIALTGPYGSGKSSILNTFQEQHSKEYSFLSISLATFHKDTNDVENKLEKSILQQMIYRVHDRTIPFSRFKRIKHIRTKSIIKNLIFFFAFIIVGIYLFKPDALKGIYAETLVSRSLGTGDQQQIRLTILLALFFIVYPLFAFKIIYHFVRANLKLNKVTIANTTLEKNSGEESSSIFDKYLDEILYFFEATKYNVVIFEDLDRFDNIDIFERLRELNELINNSEQINRRVVFLYAIKDDIFGEEDTDQLAKDRTKFFDFIIPVIPIINASNSGDVLTKKIKNSPYSDEICNRFLEDVTIYIDDMRVLKNIFNEFIMYQKKLKAIGLDSNKLLAMVIYKNIYPIDFSKLLNNQGMIYEIFQRKKHIIQEQVTSIDEKIQKLEAKIKDVEVEALASIEELDYIYLKELELHNRGGSYYDIAGSRYSASSANTDRFFEHLKQHLDDNIRYYTNRKGNGYATGYDIARVFGTKQNYFEREETVKIIEKNQIQELKKELSFLKNEKQEIGMQSLQVLIANSNSRDVFSDELYKKKLLVYLLRHGYIDEMYNHYITYFYPESLSLSDIQFVFSIKNYESLPYDYPLENVEKIIQKLVGEEFKQVEVLNFDLLNYIMEHSDCKNYYEKIIERLSNGSEESVSFIDGFKARATKKAAFIRSISTRWSDFWSFIELKSNYTRQKRDEYLADILAYADITSIIQMDKKSIMSSALSKHSNFLSLVEDEVKTKELLLKLSVKFKKLDHIVNSETLYNFVVQQSLYEINRDTLCTILNDAPDITYAAVKNSGQQDVIDYVEENIDLFVEKVLLSEDIKEPEESLLELLNWKGLDNKNKLSLIKNSAVLISDICKLNEDLWPVVISENKLVRSWSNVIAAFIENGKKIPQFLVDFLNNPVNRKELKQTKIEDLEEYEQDVLELLSDEIIKCRDITDESFEELTVSIHCWDVYELAELSERRARIMVENNLLSLTPENFKALKSNFDTLHIQLTERNIDKFISKQDSFSLDTDDVKQLMGNSNISDYNKKIFVEQLVSDGLTVENLGLLIEVTAFINKHSLKIAESLLTFLINSPLTIHTKVPLLTGQIMYIDIESISEYLTKLGEPYSGIAEKGRRLRIINNQANKALVTALKSKNYISTFKEYGKKLQVNTKKNRE
ncbi:hypothetical protein FUA19_06765 [Bacillus subtilis]|nr:hypothetical protein FUA19_06765 [Bacillus subtilis]